MSDDKAYKDGDIVWVKLGNNWWPAEVTAIHRQPDGLLKHLKRKPYCVVKFFQEDAYEYVKSAKLIFPFQCHKKNEFIKKGIALFNAKNDFMEKFPSDVEIAERLTRKAIVPPMLSTHTLIINDRPDSIVKAILGQTLTTCHDSYYGNDSYIDGAANSYASTSSIRRSGDSTMRILNITPNKTPQQRTNDYIKNCSSGGSSGSSCGFNSTMATKAYNNSNNSCSSITPTNATLQSLSSTTPNSSTAAAMNMYRCSLCDFKSVRQNVLILHRKTHGSVGGGGGNAAMRTTAATVGAAANIPSTNMTIPFKKLLTTSIVDRNLSATAITAKMHDVDDTTTITATTTTNMTTPLTTKRNRLRGKIETTTQTASRVSDTAANRDENAAVFLSSEATATTTTLTSTAIRLPKKKELASMAIASKRTLRQQTGSARTPVEASATATITSPMIVADISEITLPTPAAVIEEYSSTAISALDEPSHSGRPHHHHHHRRRLRRQLRRRSINTTSDEDDIVHGDDDDDGKEIELEKEKQSTMATSLSPTSSLASLQLQLNRNALLTTPIASTAAATTAPKPPSSIASAISSTPKRTSEEIRQSLLADWSDEEKDDSDKVHEAAVKTESTNNDLEEASPPNTAAAIISETSLHNAGANNNMTPGAEAETLSRTASMSNRCIRNIPKKDRRDVVLKEFNSSMDDIDVDANGSGGDGGVDDTATGRSTPAAIVNIDSASNSSNSSNSSDLVVVIDEEMIMQPIDVDALDNSLDPSADDDVFAMQDQPREDGKVEAMQEDDKEEVEEHQKQSTTSITQDAAEQKIIVAAPLTTTTATPTTAPLSCFDFQDEEDNDNDVLTSIANFKKKYLSPDKPITTTTTATTLLTETLTNADEASLQKLSTSANPKETTQSCSPDVVEQKDKELSEEIENLLEQTTPIVLAATLTAVCKEEASVKALPIKERGKRIFKSRNRSRNEESALLHAATTVAAITTASVAGGDGGDDDAHGHGDLGDVDASNVNKPIVTASPIADNKLSTDAIPCSDVHEATANGTDANNLKAAINQNKHDVCGDNAENIDHVDRDDHGDYVDRVETTVSHGDLVDHVDRGDHVDHDDHGDHVDHDDHGDHVDHDDHGDHVDHDDHGDHVDRGGRVDHIDCVDHVDRSDLADTGDHADDADNVDHVVRDDRGMNVDHVDHDDIKQPLVEKPVEEEQHKSLEGTESTNESSDHEVMIKKDVNDDATMTAAAPNGMSSTSTSAANLIKMDRLFNAAENKEEIIPLIKHSPIEIYRRDTPDNLPPTIINSTPRAKTRKGQEGEQNADRYDIDNGNGNGEGHIHGDGHIHDDESHKVVTNKNHDNNMALHELHSGDVDDLGDADLAVGNRSVVSPPNDDNSSVGISEAGAEFGSPTSMLDDERLSLIHLNEAATSGNTLEKENGEDQQNLKEKMLKNENKIDAVEQEEQKEEKKNEKHIEKYEVKRKTEQIEQNDIEEDIEDDEEDIESPPHEALSGNELEIEIAKVKKLKMLTKTTTTTAAAARRNSQTTDDDDDVAKVTMLAGDEALNETQQSIKLCRRSPLEHSASPHLIVTKRLTRGTRQQTQQSPEGNASRDETKVDENTLETSAMLTTTNIRSRRHLKTKDSRVAKSHDEPVDGNGEVQLDDEKASETSATTTDALPTTTNTTTRSCHQKIKSPTSKRHRDEVDDDDESAAVPVKLDDEKLIDAFPTLTRSHRKKSKTPTNDEEAKEKEKLTTKKDAKNKKHKNKALEQHSDDGKMSSIEQQEQQQPLRSSLSETSDAFDASGGLQEQILADGITKSASTSRKRRSHMKITPRRRPSQLVGAAKHSSSSSSSSTSTPLTTRRSVNDAEHGDSEPKVRKLMTSPISPICEVEKNVVDSKVETKVAVKTASNEKEEEEEDDDDMFSNISPTCELDISKEEEQQIMQLTAALAGNDDGMMTLPKTVQGVPAAVATEPSTVELAVEEALNDNVGGAHDDDDSANALQGEQALSHDNLLFSEISTNIPTTTTMHNINSKEEIVQRDDHAMTPEPVPVSPVEKVRINVDVANPLSSQIANILANSQQLVGASKTTTTTSVGKKRTAKPLSHIVPICKRKKSFEDDIPSFIIERPSVAASRATTDGGQVASTTEKDAIAHVQSLCPQVKITLKEKIIEMPQETTAPAAALFDICNVPILISNNNDQQQFMSDAGGAAGAAGAGAMHIIITSDGGGGGIGGGIGAVGVAAGMVENTNSNSNNNSSIAAASRLLQRKASQSQQRLEDTAQQKQLLSGGNKQIGVDSRGNKYVIIKTPPSDLVVQSAVTPLPIVQQQQQLQQIVAPSTPSAFSFGAGGTMRATGESAAAAHSAALKSTKQSSQQSRSQAAAAATGGRKHAGNTITLPNITIKQQLQQQLQQRRHQRLSEDFTTTFSSVANQRAKTNQQYLLQQQQQQQQQRKLLAKNERYQQQQQQQQRAADSNGGLFARNAAIHRRFSTAADTPTFAKVPKTAEGLTLTAQQQLLQLQQQRKMDIAAAAAVVTSSQPPPLLPLPSRRSRKQSQHHRGSSNMPTTTNMMQLQQQQQQQLQQHMQGHEPNVAMDGIQQQQQLFQTMTATTTTTLQQTIDVPSLTTTSTSPPTTTPSTPTTTNEEQLVQIQSEENIDGASKILAVPTQPIPGYNETFLLCTMVNNNYKPIDNTPLYLDHDLNQLVPVPLEALGGQPIIIVNNPSSPPPQTASTSSLEEEPNIQGRALNSSTISDALMTTTSISTGMVSASAVSDSSDGQFFNLQRIAGVDDAEAQGGSTSEQQDGGDIVDDANAAEQMAVFIPPEMGSQILANNAIILNIEGEQIILDAATFAHIVANPDANTQLITEDGTEFVLTREVLAALEAQHEAQNPEVMEQQLQAAVSDSIGGGTGATSDILAVALAGTDLYGNEVLEIETSQHGLQFMESDGNIVFQTSAAAAALHPAHLTPPITARTSETNALLDQSPIMSTLEKPSTALSKHKSSNASNNSFISMGVGAGAATSTNALLDTVDHHSSNLDDSLAVIGVSTQSSTVPTSLELPITVTNPAIATAKSASEHLVVQFQPHRLIAAPTNITTTETRIYNDLGS